MDAHEIEVAPETVEALQDAFRVWWGRNAHVMELGGTGDVVALLQALKAALPKKNNAAGINGVYYSHYHRKWVAQIGGRSC